MRKGYIAFIAAILFGGTVKAQITVTSATHAPKIGETYTAHQYDAESFSPGPSGANVTWDFSGVLSQDTITTKSVDPATLTDVSNHPGANIGSTDDQGEGFLFVDNNTYAIVGNYAPNVYRESFTDYRVIMKYPITYGDVFNETLDGTMEVFAASLTYDRSGNTHIEADGYGTLEMPYGTINDVLRVIVVHTYSDSNSGVSIDYVDSLYMWYNADGAVLTYNVFQVQGGGPPTYSGTYADETMVSSPDRIKANAKISIFPNPTQTGINIVPDKNYRNARVQIADLTGKIIETRPISNFSERITIDVSGLVKGIYIVQLFEDNSIVSTEKIILN